MRSLQRFGLGVLLLLLGWGGGDTAQGLDFFGSASDPGMTPGVLQRLGATVPALTGAVPAVATGAADCGTSPSIVGNNTTGAVTVGSSTNGGKCTVTFVGVWPQTPHCFCNNRTAAARTCQAVGTTNTTNATTALTATSTLTAGDVLDYLCLGHL